MQASFHRLPVGPWTVFVLAAALLWSTASWAGAQAGTQKEAMARIERMVTAARTLNYDATFVYHHGGMMDQMRIIHRYAEGSERERLVTLSGSTREVLRDDSRVTCIIPDSQSVVVGKSRPQALYGSSVLTASGYDAHYRLSLAGKTRVAGRTAELIKIEPKDKFRYGYRLWVDEESGLLLRSELVSESGATLESIVYTSLKTPKQIPDELLEPEIDGNGFSWYTSTEPESAQNRSSVWRTEWLPPGFTMRDRESAPMPTGRMPVEHLVYGDGLASLSVYIEALDTSAMPLEGGSRMGAMSAYGRMVGKYQVTVVGEVPAATVQAVGRAIAKAN